MNKIDQLKSDIAELEAQIKVDAESKEYLAEPLTEAKKQLAELEGKPAPKKTTRDKLGAKKGGSADWQKEAVSLGIKYVAKKKVDVLAEIARVKGGGEPKETPAAKPTSSKLDKTKEVNILKGKMKLVKVSPTEWKIDLDKKGQSFNGGKISKIADKYNVVVSHKTIGFESFEEAVKHLETELYSGVLGDMIDEKVNKAKAAKISNDNPINTTKSLKNEKDALKNKIDKDGITKTEATKNIDELVGITKVIKNGLDKKKDKLAFLKDLVKVITKMIKELE